MAESRAVHECLFCPQTFGSAADKDDHVLEHFAQEICIDCDQNLIRIGGKLYTLHDAATCVKREVKSDQQFEACVVDQSVLLSNDVKTELESNELEQDSQSIDDQNEQLDNLMLDWIEKTNSDDIHQIEQHQNALDDEMQIKIEPETVQIEQQHAKVDGTVPVENANSHSSPNQSGASEIHANDFECTLCEKFLSSRAALRIHNTRLHSAPGALFCNSCAKLFSSQKELNEHQPICASKKHERMKRYEEKTRPKLVQQKPANVCSKSKTVECEICGQMLAAKSFRNHNLLKHSSPDTIVCRICSKIFETQAELDEHRPQCISKKRENEARRRMNYLKDQSQIEPKIALKDIGKIQCHVCEKEFELRASLKRHMQTVHSQSEKTVQCDLCSATFWYDYEMKRHICPAKTSNEQITGKYTTCQFCAKFIPRNKLTEHLIRAHFSGHEKDPLKCALCDEIFENASFLRRHMWMKHIRSTYECYVCHREMTSKQGLERHMRVKHISNAKIFKCKLCATGFLYKYEINRHLCPAKDFSKEISDASAFCDICGKLMLKKSLVKHRRTVHSIATTDPSSGSGSGSGTTFKSNQNDRKHTQTTAEPSQSAGNQMAVQQINFKQCLICNMEFSSKRGFTRHMVSKHNSKARQFKCESCAAIFFDADKLKRHICAKRLQSMCDICGKTMQKYSIPRHKKESHGIGPGSYTCDVCGDVFRTYGGIRLHKRIQHDPNYKAFECDNCEKTFNYAHSLRKHQVLEHSPPETIFCSICAKIYPSEADLNEHKTNCEKKRKEKRAKMMRIHNCPTCGIGIKGSFNLNKHIQIVHEKKPRKKKSK